jgi:hypothetical protein
VSPIKNPVFSGKPVEDNKILMIEERGGADNELLTLGLEVTDEAAGTFHRNHAPSRRPLFN